MLDYLGFICISCGFFSVWALKIPIALFYPRLQLQATSGFWLSVANWSVTKHSYLQIQDKIKHLEEKLFEEEHQHKLLQAKAAQVHWNCIILSPFLLLKETILSVQNSFLITYKLHI